MFDSLLQDSVMMMEGLLTARHSWARAATDHLPSGVSSHRGHLFSLLFVCFVCFVVLMSSTLPIGDFSWCGRWTFSDRLEEKPTPPDNYTAANKLGNAPNRPANQEFSFEESMKILDAPLPERPRRYLDGSRLRFSSTYAESYRKTQEIQLGKAEEKTQTIAAASNGAAGSSASFSERRGFDRPRGPRKVLPNLRVEENFPPSASLRPEQRSFQMWGRMNPAHCVFPYETESQRQFSLDSSILSSDAQLNSSSYRIRVARKDFVEAEQKAKAVDASGVHSNKNLKPFSHARGIAI